MFEIFLNLQGQSSTNFALYQWGKMRFLLLKNLFHICVYFLISSYLATLFYIAGIWQSFVPAVDALAAGLVEEGAHGCGGEPSGGLHTRILYYSYQSTETKQLTLDSPH